LLRYSIATLFQHISPVAGAAVWNFFKTPYKHRNGFHSL
jgi:hypothetical protein